MKEQSFRSKQYALHYSTQTGTFIIERMVDNKTTLRFVCSEGWADYKKLKRAYRINRGKFNQLCDSFDYYADGEY